MPGRSGTDVAKVGVAVTVSNVILEGGRQLERVVCVSRGVTDGGWGGGITDGGWGGGITDASWSVAPNETTVQGAPDEVGRGSSDDNSENELLREREYRLARFCTTLLHALLQASVRVCCSTYESLHGAFWVSFGFAKLNGEWLHQCAFAALLYQSKTLAEQALNRYLLAQGRQQRVTFFWYFYIVLVFLSLLSLARISIPANTGNTKPLKTKI